MNRNNIEIVTILKGIFAPAMRSLRKVNIENEIKSNIMPVYNEYWQCGAPGDWARYCEPGIEREGGGWWCAVDNTTERLLLYSNWIFTSFFFWNFSSYLGWKIKRGNMRINLLIFKQTSLSISEFNSPIGAISCGVISIGGYNYWGGMINYRQTLI